MDRCTSLNPISWISNYFDIYHKTAFIELQEKCISDFHENMKAVPIFILLCLYIRPKIQNIPHEFQKFFLTRVSGKHNNTIISRERHKITSHGCFS